MTSNTPSRPPRAKPLGQAGAIFLLALVGLSCSGGAPQPGGTIGVAMEEGVTDLARRIASDLADEGPRAWLRHFERSPAFFMATDGRLLFPSNAVADSFVEGLATRISRIELTWGDFRVDSLAPGLAMLATPFGEAITDSAGRTDHIAGYFTALVSRGDSGWRIRNAHWSLQGETAGH